MDNVRTLEYICHSTYFCFLSSLHMGQDLLFILGWLNKFVILSKHFAVFEWL